MVMRILLAILFVIVYPTLMVWGGWWLVGIVPADARAAIMTLVPYGIVVVAWCLLAWFWGNIFAAIID